MPAEDPILAIILSSVFSPKVIHFTSANDVNEKTKVIQADAIIEGNKIGSQKFFSLKNEVFPPGSNLICSRYFGLNWESTGSQNRITKAMLNQAWAINNVTNQVD